ncbi:hypothetical protein KC347_g155 [Hortaea werneckii]|nr:hypothetical protein KC347_g155 [Hortaea werneckii]
MHLLTFWAGVLITALASCICRHCSLKATHQGDAKSQARRIHLVVIRDVQSRNGLVPPIQQHIDTALQTRHTAIVPIDDHSRPTGIPSRPRKRIQTVHVEDILGVLEDVDVIGNPPVRFVRADAGVEEDDVGAPRQLLSCMGGRLAHVAPAIRRGGGCFVDEDAIDVETHALGRRRAPRSRPSGVLGDVGPPIGWRAVAYSGPGQLSCPGPVSGLMMAWKVMSGCLWAAWKSGSQAPGKGNMYSEAVEQGFSGQAYATRTSSCIFDRSIYCEFMNVSRSKQHLYLANMKRLESLAPYTQPTSTMENCGTVEMYSRFWTRLPKGKDSRSSSSNTRRQRRSSLRKLSCGLNSLHHLPTLLIWGFLLCSRSRNKPPVVFMTVSAGNPIFQSFNTSAPGDRMYRLIMIRREPPLILMKHMEKVESELEPLGGW